MSDSIIFSPEAADELNEAAKKIAPHFFVFCNYNPNLLSPLYADGKFLLGVLNLYKLTNDASLAKGMCDIAKKHGWRSLSDKLGNIIWQAEFLRGALAHNNSLGANSQSSLWLYNRWVKEKTGKDKLTVLNDYNQALKALEKLGQDFSISLAEFMVQVSKSAAQASIIEEWEEKIVNFYFNGTKGETIIKQQLRDFIHAKMAQNGARESEINDIYYSNGQIAKWAKEFYINKFDSKLKQYERLVSMGLSSKTLKSIAEKCQELKADKGNKQKEIAAAQNRSIDELRTYDYLDYYIKQAKVRMEEAMANPGQIDTLLPEGFIASMVANDMGEVPLSIR